LLVVGVGCEIDNSQGGLRYLYRWSGVTLCASHRAVKDPLAAPAHKLRHSCDIPPYTAGGFGVPSTQILPSAQRY
jgi:hypothetical protein